MKHTEQGSTAYTRRNKPLRYDDDILARVEAVAGPEAVANMTGHSPYHEVHRRVGDQVKVTTCCCNAAGATPRACADVSGNKTPCRCYCHSRRIAARSGS